MSNIKLSGHTWDTSGVYDVTEGKTQDQVNSGVKSLLRYHGDLFWAQINNILLKSGSTSYSGRTVTRNDGYFTVKRTGAGSTWSIHSLTGSAYVYQASDMTSAVAEIFYNQGCFVNAFGTPYTSNDRYPLLLQVYTDGTAPCNGTMGIATETDVIDPETEEVTHTFNIFKVGSNVVNTVGKFQTFLLPKRISDDIYDNKKILFFARLYSGYESSTGSSNIRFRLLPQSIEVSDSIKSRIDDVNYWVDSFGDDWSIGADSGSNNMATTKYNGNLFALSGTYSGSYSYRILSNDDYTKITSLPPSLANRQIVLPPNRNFKFIVECIAGTVMTSSDISFYLYAESSIASVSMKALSDAENHIVEKSFTTGANAVNAALLIRGRTATYSGTYRVTIKEVLSFDKVSLVTEAITEDGDPWEE